MKQKLSTVAIVVAAGTGSRAGAGVPKQYRVVRGKPMIWHSVTRLAQHPQIDAVYAVIASGQESLALPALSTTPFAGIIVGGAERRDSVFAALEYLMANFDVDHVLIHDAARPFLPQKVIDDLLTALVSVAAVVPALPVIDTLAKSSDGMNLQEQAERDGLWRIQTPQAFHFSVLYEAHTAWPADQLATDDAQMVRRAGYDVKILSGDEQLAKFTFADDFRVASAHGTQVPYVRIGTGFDVHRFSAGEELWLCGVSLEHDMGLAGHSDADVALHALTDAILGAVALGDIGQHFPPSDPQWRGVSSDRFVAHAVRLAADKGYVLGNIDITIICEAPKIGPHRDTMRARLSEIVDVAVENISIKATTTEGLGYTGRGEGIAAQAVVTLMREGGQ